MPISGPCFFYQVCSEPSVPSASADEPACGNEPRAGGCLPALFSCSRAGALAPRVWGRVSQALRCSPVGSFPISALSSGQPQLLLPGSVAPEAPTCQQQAGWAGVWEA